MSNNVKKTYVFQFFVVESADKQKRENETMHIA